MTQFTFKTDDGLYDVEKLNDTAKTAFNYQLRFNLKYKP